MGRKTRREPRVASQSEVALIYSLLNYQYGGKAGETVLGKKVLLTTYKSGIPRNIIVDGELLGTYNPLTGSISLSPRGAELVFNAIPGNNKRIVVTKKDFIKHAKTSLLAPIVTGATKDIRMGDEVFIVSENGELLATGKALLSSIEIMKAKKGEVARIRRMMIDEDM